MKSSCSSDRRYKGDKEPLSDKQKKALKKQLSLASRGLKMNQSTPSYADRMKKSSRHSGRKMKKSMSGRKMKKSSGRKMKSNRHSGSKLSSRNMKRSYSGSSGTKPSGRNMRSRSRL